MGKKLVQAWRALRVLGPWDLVLGIRLAYRLRAWERARKVDAGRYSWAKWVLEAMRVGTVRDPERLRLIWRYTAWLREG